MMIDFNLSQYQKFDNIAQKILANPACYLNFDSVADVYQAEWLKEFPTGTQLCCTGLDDGAEDFDVRIWYKESELIIYHSDKQLIQYKPFQLK